MVLPQNLFWLGRPYAVNSQECEHLCETLLTGFCRIMVLPQNLFWLGRPYAVNPQECEHLCETLLAGFCRIMVLPQISDLARQTLCLGDLARFCKAKSLAGPLSGVQRFSAALYG